MLVISHVIVLKCGNLSTMVTFTKLHSEARVEIHDIIISLTKRRVYSQGMRECTVGL